MTVIGSQDRLLFAIERLNEHARLSVWISTCTLCTVGRDGQITYTPLFVTELLTNNTVLNKSNYELQITTDRMLKLQNYRLVISNWLVAWHSERRTLASKLSVPRSTCS